MGQLLVMLIVPPIVGVVTYIIIRRIWERDENGASEAVRRRDLATCDYSRTACEHSPRGASVAAVITKRF
jgi:hypothetical protein